MTRLRTDRILFLTIVSMVGFGLVMLYSASVAQKSVPYYFAVRQIGWAVISFAVMMAFKKMNYRRLNSPAWAFSGLGIVLALLVAVYFYDSGPHGSHRWFRFDGIGSFQPSEFAKPALIVFLAHFVARRANIINDKKTLRQALLAVLLLGALVVVADLGTALVPLITAVLIFWVAGLNWSYTWRVALIGIFVVLVAVVTRGYRLGRVISFFDPQYKIISIIDTHNRIRSYVESSTNVADPKYQGDQAEIAVGSGGLFGVGLMRGKQKLGFLPDPHTDFIFAAIAEELGFWGPALILAGFLIILWRGARLFVLARDDFGKYLALGVTLTIVVQALMNMTVVLGMAPTKGFPLPLISFGGSSLLSTLMILGMLLSVSEHEG